MKVVIVRDMHELQEELGVLDGDVLGHDCGMANLPTPDVNFRLKNSRWLIQIL